jgi:hypothetical protein
MGLDTGEAVPIGSLPTLHFLVQNARLPLQYLRMLSERRAAVHDVALGPVLRDALGPGNCLFLGAYSRYENEKQHPARGKNVCMRWFHGDLRCDESPIIVAAF